MNAISIRPILFSLLISLSTGEFALAVDSQIVVSAHATAPAARDQVSAATTFEELATKPLQEEHAFASRFNRYYAPNERTPEDSLSILGNVTSGGALVTVGSERGFIEVSLLVQ